MNPGGHRANLKPAHPGNRNAEKTGLNSARRRAEKAAKVKRALAKDPQGFLAQDEAARYADLRAFVELASDDIAERGLSDRSGKQRRVVGTYLRAHGTLEEMGARMQARLAANDYDDAEPCSASEVMSVLRAIVHDPQLAPGARVGAARILLAHAPEVKVDRDFYADLEKLSNEELLRLLEQLRVPVSDGPVEHFGKTARELIGSLAQETEIGDDELLDLWEVIGHALRPGRADR